MSRATMTDPKLKMNVVIADIILMQFNWILIAILLLHRKLSPKSAARIPENKLKQDIVEDEK